MFDRSAGGFDSVAVTRRLGGGGGAGEFPSIFEQTAKM